MNELRIRVVVYQEDGWWLIRGLDRHFLTVTRRLEDVPGEIRRFLMILFDASLKMGVEPFYGYERAPGKYWDLYEKAAPWLGVLPAIELPDEMGAAPEIDTRLAA